MRCALAVALLLGVNLTASQAPTGPVAPKQATTAAGVETALKGYMKAGADDKVWAAADPKKRAELVDQTRKLNEQIMQVVGPVAPKPVVPVAPKPPAPKPPTPGTGPKKSDWDDELKALEDVLQKATKVNPQKALPADAAKNAQVLLDALSKAKQ